MERISTIRELVEQWPSRREFAADVDVPVERVHKWVGANSVPVRYHRSVLDAVGRRGLIFTAEDLVDIHCPAQQGAA
ncbi:MAG: hypothetical protein RID96_17470 [Nitratireductor sp.]